MGCIVMPKSKFGGIYRDLKARIERGEYPEQTSLPSENVLIGVYQCSRNTVRRALAELAAEGYVHLLTPAQMRSKIPGDPPEMVRARRDFLASGNYDFLADALTELLLGSLTDPAVLFDAGCQGKGIFVDFGENMALCAVA